MGFLFWIPHEDFVFCFFLFAGADPGREEEDTVCGGGAIGTGFDSCRY